MIGVEVKQTLYIVTLPKCTLVMTKAQFVAALKAGKWWKRRQALRARAPEGQQP